MSRNDPYANFNFRVEIDGIATAAFSEVSGLDLAIDVIEYREGDDIGVRVMPGRPRPGRLTLKRGIANSNDLAEWIATVAGGVVDRRNLAVILMRADRTDVARWKIGDAWPSKYSAGPFSATASDVAIEELELVFETLAIERM